MSLTSLIEQNVDTIFTSVGDLIKTVIYTKTNSGDFDPFTSSIVKNIVPVTLEVIETKFKSFDFSETSGILPQDKKIIIKGKDITFDPSKKDTITIDSKKHEVVSWRTVPGNSIYIFQVRSNA